MSVNDFTTAEGERKSHFPVDQDSQQRSHSMVVFARNLLIGGLCGLIAFALHKLFQVLLLARKLNY